MRYQYWDVILFPAESHIPIQEFKTACYVSQGQGQSIHILQAIQLNVTALAMLTLEPISQMAVGYPP